MSAIAVGIGALSTLVAWVLVKLIGIVTNLAYYQRWGTNLASPAGSHLGPAAVIVPAIGGLIVGLMARYGSERIRGHGVPEAIEAILISGSKVEPKVAVLKPVSAAIAIGTGGPFGAEGPIIMTGGAVGSLVAQLMHMTSAERKTLLAAGAAAGMSAIFASPVAGVLLAFEVLLFEFKPRSLIPVALASATAGALRPLILGQGPVFPAIPHGPEIGLAGYLGCVVVGVSSGILSALLTTSIYAAEDLFRKLPIHWMWWPALGGLMVGLGGLLVPRALGVGYDVIGGFIQGNILLQAALGIFLVKWLIWSVALSTGTSGGVLAPIFMIGAALGTIEASFLPHESAGLWALLGMGATMGGVYRAPLTGIVFTLETTHDLNALLPLLVTVFVSYGIMSLALRRSILTEKVARRGFLISQEFSVDPLELIAVRQIMTTNVTALAAETPIKEIAGSISAEHGRHTQQLYPVVDENGRMAGVVTRRQLTHLDAGGDNGGRVADILNREPVVAHPSEPLRVVLDRMIETGLTRLPVVDWADPHSLLGLISMMDVFAARLHALESEWKRDRPLRVHMFRPSRRRPQAGREPGSTTNRPAADD